MENPKIKIGDQIILKRSKNSATAFENKSLKVVSICADGYSNFTVQDKKGAICTIFNTSPADTYVLGGRKEQIEYLKEELKELNSKKEELTSKLNHLEKYESEEEFVAEKLDSILTAHSSNKSKKGRTSAIANILKELKSSDLL